jgi:hypothetical protein
MREYPLINRKRQLMTFKNKNSNNCQVTNSLITKWKTDPYQNIANNHAVLESRN